ncbi:MAG: thioredoxin fold domain-containing protein [Desulfobacterales bacterium]|nr:thioredoxin fold domain-containing protein [Desulfobacterales bacterium]
MKKIIGDRKDIAFFIKLYPLRSHPEAYEKSKAIVCEKSLALLEDAYENKPLPKAKCETTVIDENIALAGKLGINSLPTLILPDGRVVRGYKDAQTLQNLIGK